MQNGLTYKFDVCVPGTHRSGSPHDLRVRPDVLMARGLLRMHLKQVRKLKRKGRRKTGRAKGQGSTTVRHRGIETGISEASKRVSIFSFATQGGK